MFTGIIEEIGKIKSITQKSGQVQLEVSAQKITADMKSGDSIAVNGICLTVTGFSTGYFSAFASSETVALTTIQSWLKGHNVNLERALRPSDRMGGHFVQGHVDGTGTVKSITKTGESREIKITYPPHFRDLLLPKGSVCVDGISLTINSIDYQNSFFTIRIIPATIEHTNIGEWKTGTEVNLESDMIGRHIVQYLDHKFRDSGASSRQEESSDDFYKKLNELKEKGF